jgi:spore coat protein U-like protein
MSRLFAALCLMLLSLGFVPVAGALTCTISAQDVSFGSINPLAGTEVDVSANVQVSCSDLIFPLVDNTVGVCIYLDAGDGGTDGSAFRFMRQGAVTLPYNLYKDAARSQIWGSETAFPASGAQRVIVTLTGLLPSTGTLNVPVYGRVPATVAGLPVGSYLSTFAGGARARYSLSNTIACNGVTGQLASDTFVANGSIAGTCTVEADDLGFGTETQLDADVDAMSQVRASCSTGLAYSIALGTGSGGAFGSRRMEHDSVPADAVGYQLYVDESRTQVWGDGSGGTVTSGGTGDGSPQPVTVYGRVPPQSTPRPGDYADTVIVTVTY